MTKKLNLVQDLLAHGASEEEIFRSVDDYEHAFHKFVDAHEKNLRSEDDEEVEAVAKESYEKEIECKFLLDVDISKWKVNMKYEMKAMRNRAAIRVGQVRWERIRVPLVVA